MPAAILILIVQHMVGGVEIILQDLHVSVEFVDFAPIKNKIARVFNILVNQARTTKGVVVSSCAMYVSAVSK